MEGGKSMALQVWLPLTKDLRNQGLSNVTVTNNGATFNSAGKLGGCYSFSGSSQKIVNTLPSTITSSVGSLSCWIKMNSLPGSSSFYNLLQLGNLGGYATCRLGLYMEYTNYINISIDGSDTSSNRYTHSMVTNQWYHICVTYDGTIIKLYIDGNEVLSKTASKGSYTTAASNLYIGGTSSYYLNGYMNDARYYNHCLSPMEVKQLSQGLVLHYPLSSNSIQQMDNCYSYPRFETSSSDGGWSHWGSAGHKGTYGQTTDTNYIFRNGQTYAHWVADGSSATKDYLLYQGPAFDGGLRSLVAICKEENSKPITNDICYANWNARNGGVANNSWTSIQSLGNGFYLCKCEGISQDGSNDLVGIYIKPGYKVYFSEVYLENNRSISSDMFFPTNIVYDCSGFCNNGTISGALTVSNDAPKYKVSTHFSSAQIKRDSLEGEIKTLACWVKTTANKSTSQFVVADYNSNMCISFYSGCIIGVFGTTRGTGSKSTLGNSYKENDWNHIVVVKTGDAGERAIYCNGVLLTPTTNDYWSNAAGFLVSGRNTSNTLPMQGYISDVRAYATALSADDVKSLYQNSAYIDSSGNVYGAVHSEV